MRCIDKYDKIPPCDLPMVPLVPMVPLAAEKRFLVTIGKNGTNSTIGRFADFTIGRTPNVARVGHGEVTINNVVTIIKHNVFCLFRYSSIIFVNNISVNKFQ